MHATTTLLDACRRRELEQVVFVSTTETYGRKLPPWPVTESWVPRPLGPALQSRVAAERVARTYRRRVPLSILRPAPLVSHGGGTVMQVIQHFISRPRAALVGSGEAPVSILGRGRSGARGLGDAEPDGGGGRSGVFHIASAHTTWRELAVEACQLRGVEARFWSAPYFFARSLDAPAPVGLGCCLSRKAWTPTSR